MRKRLPMLFSSAALLVAVLGITPLGEAAYNQLVPRNSVGTLQLQRNAVKPAKIAPNAVRTGHVLNGSLLVDDFKQGQIPQGPKGEKGDRGEKGDQGAPGVSGYEIVTQTQTANTTLFNVTATCPANKRVFGGGTGANLWALSSGPYVVSSNPNAAGTAWVVRMAFHSAPGNTTVTAYAVCGSVS
jgi:hypothetical protein